MYKRLVAVIALTLPIAFAAPAWAKTETITGKVIDMSCYTKDKANNAGMDHKMPAATKDCALACAKEGNPLALLTSDGKVYQITGGLADNKNAKLIPHITHTVSITGDTMDMSGKMSIKAADLKMVSAK